MIWGLVIILGGVVLWYALHLLEKADRRDRQDPDTKGGLHKRHFNKINQGR